MRSLLENLLPEERSIESDSIAESESRREFLKGMRDIFIAAASFPTLFSLACGKETKKEDVTKGGEEETQEGEETGQTELTEEELDEIKAFLKELFGNNEFNKINPPKGKKNQEYREKWLKRYQGKDENYRYPLRELLLNGWSAFLESAEYETVSKILRNEEVPLFFIFLAAAESEFNHEANSNKKAKGMWQFIPETAESYGLLKGKWNKKHTRITKITEDHRDELEKATRAACKLLKDLYEMVERWESAVNKKRGDEVITLSESDKWFYAMCAYNRSPAKVYKTFIKTNGLPVDYIKVCPNNESDNYAARIFAISQFLKEYFESGEPLITKATVTARAPKCEADRKYDAIKANLQKEITNPQEVVKELESVIEAYNKDFKDGRIAAVYLDSALEIVMHDIKTIKQKFPGVFDTIEAVNGVAVAVETDSYGETVIEKVAKPVTEEIPFESVEDMLGKFEIVEDLDVATYKLRPSDNLGKIATWLCGDKSKVFTVQNLIKKLNPEITDWDMLRIGLTINVPSKMIEVPKTSLSTLLDEYYPGVITFYTRHFETIYDAKNGKKKMHIDYKNLQKRKIRIGNNSAEIAKAMAYLQATMYLKWVNGKDPDTDKIIPGEMIYVPAVGTKADLEREK